MPAPALYRPVRVRALLALCVVAVFGAGRAATQELSGLGIEQLLNTEITSVAKSEQKYPNAAAAVYLISAEDIRRSGATTLAEVLRLAPGLHVARVSASEWAITARGFNGRFSNKLLVLVDGRTVYTPIFSGVYWEGLDLPLDDIERIEVIRGPGASLWGANAVNGIINIISKRAADTRGLRVGLRLGAEGEAVSDLRYGVGLSETLDLRVSARFARHDGLRDLAGEDAEDDWRSRRGGFRLDWRASGRDAVTLQGDVYRADIDRRFTAATAPGRVETVLEPGVLKGLSLLAHWEHSFSLASRAGLQVYYQRERKADLFNDYRLDTFDIDFQHELALSERQTLSWGLAYRFHRDDFDPAPLFNIRPDRRDQKLFSAFVQDRIDLLDERLELTVGSKLEHNSFTGWEHQPNLRLLWKPAPQQRLWASLARAVRTPVRSERDDSEVGVFATPPDVGTPPTLVVFGGDEDFDSETVLSAELGYRFWPDDALFVDVATFHNRYRGLRSAALDATGPRRGADGLVLPIKVVNAEDAVSYGWELAADWRPAEFWRLRLSYAYQRIRFRRDGRFDGQTLFPADFGDDRTPRQQAALRSSFDLAGGLELDLDLRYVGRVREVQVASRSGVAPVDDYLSLDLRLGWRPHERLEIAVGARNLGDVPRVEFLKEINTVPTQQERSVYAQLVWRF